MHSTTERSKDDCNLSYPQYLHRFSRLTGFHIIDLFYGYKAFSSSQQDGFVSGKSDLKIAFYTFACQ